MPREHSEFYQACIQTLLAEAFHQAGWRIEKEPRYGFGEAEFLVHKDDLMYIVETKRASGGRPDRLVPPISQAILQAQSAAREYGFLVSPLSRLAPRGCICSPRISACAQ
jgi:hypothetical protein